MVSDIPHLKSVDFYNKYPDQYLTELDVDELPDIIILPMPAMVNCNNTIPFHNKELPYLNVLKCFPCLLKEHQNTEKSSFDLVGSIKQVSVSFKNKQIYIYILYIENNITDIIAYNSDQNIKNIEMCFKYLKDHLFIEFSYEKKLMLKCTIVELPTVTKQYTEVLSSVYLDQLPDYIASITYIRSLNR